MIRAGQRGRVGGIQAGALPGSNEEGFALSQKIGDEVIAERATADLPAAAVFAGISFGVLSAQRRAQTHAGARGSLPFVGRLPFWRQAGSPDFLARLPF